ncbi:hypothetical protein ACFU7D_25175 [Nocardioides sp. NPDC057577]|uniref:phosphotriesterase family protein n=1 Tax=Nocardioides sp. NPDC057577 TaxID=3346171 RepID=UPI00367006B6
MGKIVNTVLGPVPSGDLGVTLTNEALLSVLPGAQYAYDITLDRAAVFETLATKLRAFKQSGGGGVVDVTGQFAGRDLRLYEALSRATGVHLIASTGQGPEGMLGGYFLTPQTNPPTPWPAEKWADLFGAEVTDGMVVPRVERRGHAGVIATAVTAEGATPTDVELLRGSARAALATGVPVTFVAGADAVAELAVVTQEGLSASRVAVSSPGSAAAKLAEQGAYVVLAGASEAVALAEAGHADRILIATGGVGQAFGHEVPEAAYDRLISAVRADLPGELADQILITNPATLLAVKED